MDGDACEEVRDGLRGFKVFRDGRFKKGKGRGFIDRVIILLFGIMDYYRKGGLRVVMVMGLIG